MRMPPRVPGVGAATNAEQGFVGSVGGRVRNARPVTRNRRGRVYEPRAAAVEGQAWYCEAVDTAVDEGTGLLSHLVVTVDGSDYDCGPDEVSTELWEHLAAAYDGGGWNAFQVSWAAGVTRAHATQPLIVTGAAYAGIIVG